MPAVTTVQMIERWENMVRVLSALTPKQRRENFDMHTWGMLKDNASGLTPCGTIACAAGHCGLDPWFRRRGFKLAHDRRGIWFPNWHPAEFFDSEGYKNILTKMEKRPVSVVIREVKAHIKYLKRWQKISKTVRTWS